MDGWILVAPDGLVANHDLQRWIDLGYDYASTLPEKK